MNVKVAIVLKYSTQKFCIAHFITRPSKMGNERLTDQDIATFLLYHDSLLDFHFEAISWLKSKHTIALRYV